jgi:uncharacterized protein HemX
MKDTTPPLSLYAFTACAGTPTLLLLALALALALRLLYRFQLQNKTDNNPVRKSRQEIQTVKRIKVDG